MVFVGIYAIASMGLTLLAGYCGQISFGHSAFLAIGAYSSAMLTTRLHLPPLVALIIGAVLAGFIAYVIGIQILKLKGHYLAMGTLALGEIVYNLLNGLKVFGGVGGIFGIPRFSLFGYKFNSVHKNYYLVLVFVLLCVWITGRLVNSRTGRALRAVGGNESAAKSVGIDVGKLKAKVLLVSGVYAGLAGSLFAHFVTYVDPSSFSTSLSIVLVAIILVGGAKNISGAILGAFIMTMLPESVRVYEDYNQLIYGALLIVVLLTMPNGISGLISGAIKKISKWFTDRATVLE